MKTIYHIKPEDVLDFLASKRKESIVSITYSAKDDTFNIKVREGYYDSILQTLADLRKAYAPYTEEFDSLNEAINAIKTLLDMGVLNDD